MNAVPQRDEVSLGLFVRFPIVHEKSDNLKTQE